MAGEKPSFTRVLLPGDDRRCLDAASEFLVGRVQRSFWASSNFSRNMTDIFRYDRGGPKLSRFYIVADVNPSNLDGLRGALGSSDSAAFLLSGETIFSKKLDRFSYMTMYYPDDPYGSPVTRDVIDIMARKERVDGLYVSSVELVCKREPKFYFNSRQNSLCIDVGGEHSYAENQRYCGKIFDKDVVRKGVRYEPNFSFSILDKVKIGQEKRILPRQKPV